MKNTACTLHESDLNTTEKNAGIPFKLWYDQPASVFASEHKPRVPNGSADVDEAWEKWSLPIGNGFFGANVFGRCEVERIQISEKTLVNPHEVKNDAGSFIVGGTNSFSETFIDFNHSNAEISDYNRYLDLKTAISGVRYKYRGVTYTREYFTSYPDRALVIRLDADNDGALSFTLRPTIPYKQSYKAFKGDNITKTGTVTSSVKNGVGEIELCGSMGFYGVDFIGMYKVYAKGGQVIASTVKRTYKDTDETEITDTDGTIVVNGARSAYIVVTLGTDYELSSDIFTSPETDKPTKKTTVEDARAKVQGYMNAIGSMTACKSFDDAYALLKERHVADHSELFGRVSVDLGFKKSDFELTTDVLLDNYKNGEESTYLEALLFQYGRYLLIASSRNGSLPANLQGVWNTYNMPAWACDYTHNINVEMNYWPAFQTNIAETFDAYVSYNKAYMKQAERYADDIIKEMNPDVFGKDGGNGWVLGDHTTAYKYSSHRSAGNLGFMTQVFWDWYEYTKSPEVLQYVYRLLVNAARYVTKCVKPDENGKYLIQHCDSPEMYVNGAWYYTSGTTYAQSFAYLNNYYALSSAKAIGIDITDTKLLSEEEYSVLNTIIEQLDKYDPIHVGLSGQIKEFREEDYYCSVGDEYKHRHIAQLVGLHPGKLINATTPAWLDASKVTLTERGDSGTGWGISWKANLWARTKDGDKAHTLIKNLLKTFTSKNLWTICPPFQIDANFGAAAGISEMLLQSHEGYIAPLAAIPKAWSNGSYTGLVARGNFEISAEWENGFAKSFNIISGRGGTAAVYYPSVTGATVTDKNGNEIKFSIIRKNLISFETEQGEAYTVRGFKRTVSPSVPTGLKFTSSKTGARLSWKASSNATGYNIYIAKNNDAQYTLIGTAQNEEFVCDAGLLDSNTRITFAVTATSDDGAESNRALAYRNPRVITEYGVIPAENTDMPFALFENGADGYVYSGSYASYSEAVNALESSRNCDRGVIYVVKNAKINENESVCSYSKGVEIDLATRSLVLYNPLFDIDTAKTKAFKIKIKNGKILTAYHSAVEVSSSSDSKKTESRACEIEFENVVFGRERYVDETKPIFTEAKETYSNGLKINVLLKECTVDYISTKETESVTLFDFEEKEEPIITVRFEGGSVKLQSLRKLPLFNGKRDGKILFTKNASGNLASFKLTDAEEPDLIFNTDGKECVLKAIGREKVHYTIYTYYALYEDTM